MLVFGLVGFTNDINIFKEPAERHFQGGLAGGGLGADLPDHALLQAGGSEVPCVWRLRWHLQTSPCQTCLSTAALQPAPARTSFDSCGAAPPAPPLTYLAAWAHPAVLPLLAAVLRGPLPFGAALLPDSAGSAEKVR